MRAAADAAMSSTVMESSRKVALRRLSTATPAEDAAGGWGGPAAGRGEEKETKPGGKAVVNNVACTIATGPRSLRDTLAGGARVCLGVRFKGQALERATQLATLHTCGVRGKE